MERRSCVQQISVSTKDIEVKAVQQVSSLIQYTTLVYIPQEILAKFRQHIDMGLMYGKLLHCMLKW